MGDASKHFNYSEFACKCGKCGFESVDVRQLEIAEYARVIIGPYSPNSACRCLQHNEKVQKEANKHYKPYSSRSRHLYGMAQDIPSDDPQLLYNLLDKEYPDKYCIIKYRWGVHIDVRREKVRIIKS